MAWLLLTLPVGMLNIKWLHGGPLAGPHGDPVTSRGPEDHISITILQIPGFLESPVSWALGSRFVGSLCSCELLSA